MHIIKSYMEVRLPGEDFLTVFKHALEDSQESELPIEIEAL